MLAFYCSELGGELVNYMVFISQFVRYIPFEHFYAVEVVVVYLPFCPEFFNLHFHRLVIYLKFLDHLFVPLIFLEELVALSIAGGYFFFEADYHLF